MFFFFFFSIVFVVYEVKNILVVLFVDQGKMEGAWRIFVWCNHYRIALYGLCCLGFLPIGLGEARWWFGGGLLVVGFGGSLFH